MSNFLDPAILFFIFGVFAGMVRSNLEIPRSIAKFLSLYLLMALGLKGGFALSRSGITSEILLSLLAAMFMAAVVPLIGYQFLKNRISRYDAAAVAATYGSISAVTFVTAIQFLEHRGYTPGGHMAVAMVLMETPAIMVAILLANALRQQQVGAKAQPFTLKNLLHESFTDGAQLLLLGALTIGWITGSSGESAMQPFSGDLFKGMLAFFLLDMGLMVARNAKTAFQASPVLLAYAIAGPLLHAGLAWALGTALQLPMTDVALLMVLSASASYIVVPAVVRHAIPEANPAIYLGLSLGVTFPFNILVGIPVYVQLASKTLQ